jgi:enterobactin synthetase component F
MSEAQAYVRESTKSEYGGAAGRGASAVAPMLPLTSAQSGVWYSILSGATNASFNIAGFTEIFGEIDRNVFAKALKQAVAETQSLRATFEQIDGEPRQRLGDPQSPPFAFYDLSEEEDAESTARRWMEEDMASAIDLAKGPFLRYALFKLRKNLYYWYARYHHLVIDAFGDRLIASRVAELYSNFLAGAETLSRPLGSFDALIDEEKAYRTSERFETDRQYWREVLNGCPEPPTLKMRSHSDAAGPIRRRFIVSAETMEAIDAFSHGLNTTTPQMFTVYVTLLIHRLTGEGSVILGQYMSNRLSRIARTTPGMMSTIAPLRFQIDQETDLVALAQQVRRASQSAMRHQRFNISDIRRDLRRIVRPIIGPTINVNPFDNNLRFGDVESTLVVLATGPVEDLNFYFFKDSSVEGGWAVEISANSASYDEQCLEVLEARLVHLMDTVREPSARVDQIQIAPAHELEKTLVAWNATARPYPKDKSVLDLCEQHVHRSPTRPAVRFDNTVMSYEELNRRAECIAAHLWRRGVGAGAYVGLSVDRSVDMVAALLGVWKCGAAYIPLDPAYPPDRLNFILRDAQPAVLLTERRHRAVFDFDEASTMYLEAIDDGPPSLPKTTGARGSLAYVLYTSGSTGMPKGVCVSQKALVNFLSSMATEPGAGPDDRMLALTSLSFDIAGLELFLPLVVGAEVTIASTQEAADGRRLGELIKTCRPTILQATPTTWRGLLDTGWRGAKGLKILCGGEPWPPDLARALAPLCESLWNMYGPTETTIWSSATKIMPGRPVVIGPPIANTAFYVLDEQGQPAPIGAPGELYIGGDGIAEGYLNRPDLSAERFLPDPFTEQPGSRMYKTGDRVRAFIDGTMEFLGRLDNQIKIRGFRVELGEIEQVLRDHTSVSDAVVVSVEHRPGEKRLVGYVTGGETSPHSSSELREWVQSRLPAYMTPSAVVRLDAFPLTPNLKVDRKALSARELQADMFSNATAEVSAPRTAVEELLSNLWREALRLDSIGVHDDFFEAGGDSLSMVRLSMEVERRTTVPLPINRIHEAPTIAKMAEMLVGRRKSLEDTPLILLREGGDAKPIYIIHTIGGTTMQLVPIAKGIGGQQPVYGVEARGIDGKEPPADRVEVMAKIYCRAILKQQPSGPYYIVGMCFGGLVAIELARLLQESGGIVAFLGLLDTYPHPKYWPVGLKFSYFVMRRVREFVSDISKMPRTAAFAYVRGRAIVTVSRAFHRILSRKQAYIKPVAPLPKAIQAVLDGGNAALEHYRPRRYPGEAAYLMCGYHTYLPNGPAAVWANKFNELSVECAPPLAKPDDIGDWIFQKISMMERR